jgi:methylmalonyl-CoA/ethylmalonyl-CoA epimerase
MIKKVDHIGLAVSNLDNIVDIFTKLFNLESKKIIDDHPSVKAAFLKVGDVEIEPLQPLDEKMSQWLNLSRYGDNIHHICFEVDDVDNELQRLATMGVELINQKGHQSFAGKVGFIHPGATGGILIELVEKEK